ncbi:MAG: recombinase family protein [Clostridia bacterium]|nr:recombinase family protein [Clostridia bacterium]
MVLTKDLSRLGRDYILTGYYLEKFFPENQIRYIALIDGIDTGTESYSNDITPFRAVFNDMYAKDISNKIRIVKHNKQNLGLFIGSKAPFGYKLNKKFPNKLFIDEEAKPIIIQIFKEAALGKSCRTIAQYLNSQHIPTPSLYAISHNQKVARKSLLWSDTKIKDILQNEVYIGNMVQGRMKKINYKSKKNIRLPKSEWKIVDKTHEPIIDLNTFHKVQEMLNIRKKTRLKSNDYLLKGLVYCHECGKKMYCSSRHLASGNKYYFRCGTNIKNHTCSPHSVRMDYVENFITQSIYDIINKHYNKQTFYNLVLKTFEDNYSNSSTMKKEFSSLSDQLVSINNFIDKLSDDYISGIIMQEDFTRIYNLKLKEKQLVQTKLKNYQSKLNMTIDNVLLEKFFNKFKTEQAIDKSIITYFIDKIELDNAKKIYVYFKFNSI